MRSAIVLLMVLKKNDAPDAGSGRPRASITKDAAAKMG